MLTIQKIANELNISKATVSRAISGAGRISVKTRDRVNSYISEQGYRPNAIAQSLAQSKSFSIGVFLPKDINATLTSFFYECIVGICEVTSASNYDILLIMTERNDTADLERLVSNQKIDGLILTRMYENDMITQLLFKMKIPFLLIGESGDDRIIEVYNDYVEASCALTTSMIRAGSKKPLFIGGDSSHIVMKNRFLGFQKAHEDENLTLDSFLVMQDVKTDYYLERNLPKVLEQTRPDGIITADDVICEWTLPILDKLGYSIPKDIRIASCYNNNSLERYNPAITAVDINTTLLGKTAGHIMIDMLAGKKVEQRTAIDYTIHLCKSTM